ncbi:MAG TPA: GIY-YIG nuclease family protein [Gaiellaceae bacterium]|nr:GIY-YIG nuclease family protein [Gaiellaceae bacterium]
MPRTDPPAEVRKIRERITEFLRTPDSQGRRIGGARCGVYAFYDYDGEPIYVGQTRESLSTRIGRHLTGRRSDAVAKFVLDPFEVLEIEVWPMFEIQALAPPERKAAVDAAEYAVFVQALANSRFGAVLNEGEIAPGPQVALPASFRARIVPDDLFEDRSHPDVRIARRAQTIASLARLISERVVSKGLRTTLLVQSKRLEALAADRLQDFAGEPATVQTDEE